MIAEIIPLARLPKRLSFFDYEVPQDIEGRIKIGQMARISFRGTKVFGIVLNLKPKSVETKTGIKQLEKIISDEEALTSEGLKLLQILADYYSVSPALILKTFIPEPPLRSISVKDKEIMSGESLSIAKSNIQKIKDGLEKILSERDNFFLLKYHDQKNKNAILLKISEKIVGEGGDIMILEPQIPDIEVIAPYFLRSMPNEVAFLHGGLSKTDYWSEWKRIREGKAKIVIGTRSSVFTPFPNLSLIIIDNEEAPDFKQSDQNPRYDSRFAVMKLAKLTGSKLVFTSQAPRPETYFSIKKESNSAIIDLDGVKCPAEIVDMNDEVKNKNFSALSIKMREKVSSALMARKKAILFLNRRGAATLLVCRDCGYTFECKNCGAPLVCHEVFCNLPGKFLCHGCGNEEPVKVLCSNCRGTSIKYSGIGTQTVEKEIRKIFPKAKVARIDQDVTLDRKTLPDADIYIGTQFFIRNYLSSIKNIGFVGVVSADTLIYRPDFRSGEKTFAWLTGLINLGQREKCEVVIQTFFPNNYFIQAAASGDYESFYQKEIDERKIMGYPPFEKLIKLTYSHLDKKKCLYESENLSKKIAAAFSGGVEFSIDEGHKREKQKFSMKIIVRIKLEENLINKFIKFLKTIPDDWAIDMDPESLL